MRQSEVGVRVGVRVRVRVKARIRVGVRSLTFMRQSELRSRLVGVRVGV